MQVTAKLNYLRIAPRKVRLLARELKGMDVALAQDRLHYLAKRAQKPLAKLLDSAVANARHNFGLAKEVLWIKDIVVNEGLKLKRYRAKGFGLSMPIQKKTSQITLVLQKKEGEVVAPPLAKSIITPQTESVIPKTMPAAQKEIPPAGEKTYSQTSHMKQVLRDQKEIKTPPKGVVEGIKSFGRKMFQRKSI